MNHGNAANSLVQRALAIGVASSVALVGVSEPAYGLTVSEAIRGATHNPIVMFCGGCAAGAICAGLAVGFVSRAQYRKRLGAYIRETRAKSELGSTGVARMDANGARAAYPKKAQTKRQSVERAVVTHDQPRTQEVGTDAQMPDRTNAIGREERQETSRGVRSILLERLGTGVFDEPLVIDRGAQREARPGDFVRPHTTSGFAPVGRAAAIDRRLPRFDESLFPDTTMENSVTEEDDFELAMKAMDRTMAQSAPAEPVRQAQPVHTSRPAHAAQPAQPAHAARPAQPSHAYDSVSSDRSQWSPERTASSSRPSFGEGASFDASSYVDYLINDEMEQRSTSVATRYGRPHLTVFEGTGDLSGARAATQRQAKRPKHFARATREA